VVDSGGLLNRCRAINPTGGSNPPLSAKNTYISRVFAFPQTPSPTLKNLPA
jgi:hypothetical protein